MENHSDPELGKISASPPENDRLQRTVFLVSDSTGITIEGMARALLSQFPLHFRQIVRRYVDSTQKADATIAEINTSPERAGQTPIVLTTIINPEIRQHMDKVDGVVIDLMSPFLPQLEKLFGVAAEQVAGHSHSLHHARNYPERIDAVHFSMEHDDGQGQRHYDNADVILVGLSRCGKTPTCLYLAMHYGLFAANYPLVDTDLEQPQMPAHLQACRDRIFALTISAPRLQQIRQQRLPDTRYASRAQCDKEVRQVEALYRQWRLPSLDVTERSVEEIATAVLAHIRK
ncbi:MAG: pyruvate, water dikinase regulatory protein [Gammaproteobacteria bacterium]